VIDRDAIEWVSTRKSGSILYTSPSRGVRESSLRTLAQAAICPHYPAVGAGCDCASCFNIKAGTHPHVSIITEETFDDKMRVLHSYPTPVVQITEAHRLTVLRQTKLLIWLESIGKNRIVVLTANSEFNVLPTIRSRSVVFTEIPRYRLSEEEEFKAKIFLQNLFAGKERFESITTEDDARQMAYHLRQMVVSEIEGRMLKPPKKKLPGSDLELATLMKVLERYLHSPALHNLRLLLAGFSMLPLQSIK
jgi:hypothetical protein